jgi:hypothetical protein
MAAMVVQAVTGALEKDATVVTPDGRRARVKHWWRENRFHRPPRYRVIVEFRGGDRKSYWRDELRRHE